MQRQPASKGGIASKSSQRNSARFAYFSQLVELWRGPCNVCGIRPCVFSGVRAIKERIAVCILILDGNLQRIRNHLRKGSLIVRNQGMKDLSVSSKGLGQSAARKNSTRTCSHNGRVQPPAH